MAREYNENLINYLIKKNQGGGSIKNTNNPILRSLLDKEEGGYIEGMIEMPEVLDDQVVGGLGVDGMAGLVGAASGALGGGGLEVEGMGGYDEYINASELDQAANQIVDAVPIFGLFKGIGEAGSAMIIGDAEGEERMKKQKLAAAIFSPHKLIAMREADKEIAKQKERDTQASQERDNWMEMMEAKDGKFVSNDDPPSWWEKIKSYFGGEGEPSTKRLSYPEPYQGPRVVKDPTSFNAQEFKDVVRRAESLGYPTDYMNPNSSATGQYQPLYDDIPSEVLGGATREEFANNPELQEEVMDVMIEKGWEGNRSVNRHVKELWEEYSTQFDEMPVSPLELAMIVYKEGRQGAREWLGSVRDAEGERAPTDPEHNMSTRGYLDKGLNREDGGVVDGRLSEWMEGNRRDRRLNKTSVRSASSEEILEALAQYNDKGYMPAGHFSDEEREIIMFSDPEKWENYEDEGDVLMHEEKHASQYKPLMSWVANKMGGESRFRMQDKDVRKSHRKLMRSLEEGDFGPPTSLDKDPVRFTGQYMTDPLEYEAIITSGVAGLKNLGINVNQPFDSLLSDLNKLGEDEYVGDTYGGQVKALRNFLKNDFTEDQKQHIMIGIKG